MSYGLYVHIPFCKHICSYCDFCKMVPSNKELVSKYIDRMINEFDLYEKYYKDVETIYIGGGTPNSLDDLTLEKVLQKISSLNINPKEYSIEINPELLTLSQVNLFKKYGINRVSMGAESMDDDILKLLGRHHTSEDVINAYNLLKNNGIENINIDIIYAHPWDNLDLLNDTIDKVLSLNPPHLSFYTLILEDKTIFKYKKVKMLDDDTVSNLMDLVNDRLKDYHHYEISNYSRKGFESLHNMIYWKSMEYIGIGMGASGYLDSIRYDNNRLLKNYMNSYRGEENTLDISDKKSEYMILGLRLLDGVSRSKYKELFASNIEDDFSLDKLLKYNLIEINGDIIKMTYKGYKLGNYVFEEFI